MSHLQVQGLWESFSGILNSSDISNPTLSKFLKKAPFYLEKIPQAFLSQEEDSAETLLKKKRFIMWLIHRLLLLKLETLSQNNHVEGGKIDDIIIDDMMTRSETMLELVLDDPLFHSMSVIEGSEKR